eukprot:scaffold155787_cov29-Tisochrysis_lutea.AAC.13
MSRIMMEESRCFSHILRSCAKKSPSEALCTSAATPRVAVELLKREPGCVLPVDLLDRVVQRLPRPVRVFLVHRLRLPERRNDKLGAPTAAGGHGDCREGESWGTR